MIDLLNCNSVELITKTFALAAKSPWLNSVILFNRFPLLFLFNGSERNYLPSVKREWWWAAMCHTCHLLEGQGIPARSLGGCRSRFIGIVSWCLPIVISITQVRKKGFEHQNGVRKSHPFPRDPFPKWFKGFLTRAGMFSSLLVVVSCSSTE